MVEDLEILGITMAATLVPRLTSFKTPGDMLVVLVDREDKSQNHRFYSFTERTGHDRLAESP